MKIFVHIMAIRQFRALAGCKRDKGRGEVISDVLDLIVKYVWYADYHFPDSRALYHTARTTASTSNPSYQPILDQNQGLAHPTPGIHPITHRNFTTKKQSLQPTD